MHFANDESIRWPKDADPLFLATSCPHSIGQFPNNVGLDYVGKLPPLTPRGVHLAADVRTVAGR